MHNEPQGSVVDQIDFRSISKRIQTTTIIIPRGCSNDMFQLWLTTSLTFKLNVHSDAVLSGLHYTFIKRLHSSLLKLSSSVCF